jgi:hypothetical protein
MGAKMDKELLPYAEALKLLQDWSKTSLVLEGAILTTLGAFIDKKRVERGRVWLLSSLGLFVVSMMVALNVLGMIPDMMQQLPEVARQKDMYKFRNRAGIPLVILATSQHVFTALALGCFFLFVFKALKREGEDGKSNRPSPPAPSQEVPT